MSDTKPPAAAATLVAQYGKEKIVLADLPSATTTVGHVKEMLREKTGILPKRQKLIGLKAAKGAVGDDTPLSELKVKGNKGGTVVHQFILMGTPEEQIFVDPSEKEDLPDIIDDFDLDFNAGSEEVGIFVIFVMCCALPSPKMHSQSLDAYPSGSITRPKKTTSKASSSRQKSTSSILPGRPTECTSPSWCWISITPSWTSPAAT